MREVIDLNRRLLGPENRGEIFGDRDAARLTIAPLPQQLHHTALQRRHIGQHPHRSTAAHRSWQGRLSTI